MGTQREAEVTCEAGAAREGQAAATREGQTAEAADGLGANTKTTGIDFVGASESSHNPAQPDNSTEAASQAERAAQAEVAAQAGASSEADPQPEADPEAEAAARELAEHNALADVFDDVRRASADSRLVIPDRWADLGLVPDHLTAEEFEMFVYEWLEDYQAEHKEEIEAEIAAEKAKAASVRSATHAVGVPPKIPNRRLSQIAADEKAEKEAAGKSDGGTATEPSDASGASAGASVAEATQKDAGTDPANSTEGTNGTDAAGSTEGTNGIDAADSTKGAVEANPTGSTDGTNGTDAVSSTDGTNGKDFVGASESSRDPAQPDNSTESPTQAESIPQPKATEQPTAQPESIPTADEAAVANPDNPFANLNIPAGYRWEQIEGEWVLVKDENAGPVRKEIHCNRIKALVGMHSYYLYDQTKMTDNYARWAFLAAEDNPQITFVECVREDSRVYPRPYAAECLKNPPFRMTDDEIEQTWQAVRDSGNFPDIRRAEASNGDVYYYSTDYLEPAYAESLAEYDAVERPANV